MVRRLASKRSRVWGGRLHLHHQLLKMGWSVPKICLFYYSIGLILGILALGFDTQEKFFALSVLGVLIFSLLFTGFMVLRKIGLGGNENNN